MTVSSATENPQIVHESETQRQFVRLQMPARAVIQGNSYVVRDLSSGGMGVADVAVSFNKGERFHFALVLPFSAFALDISLEAQVQYYDAAEQRMGCRFINLTEEQISILTRIIKAFIAGEVIGEGDILNVAARENFVKVRKPKAANDATGSTLSQMASLALIFAAGLGALAFIGSNIYQSNFLMRSSQGVVAANSVQIRAASEGVYANALPAKAVTVKKGDVLARTTVIGADGVAATRNIVSPCDCYISDASLRASQSVVAGQSLFTLVPVNDQLWVNVTIPSDDAFRVRVNDKARITVAGSDLVLTGAVASIQAVDALNKPGAGEAGLMAQVAVTLDQKVPVDLAGRPAMIEFQF